MGLNPFGDVSKALQGKKPPTTTTTTAKKSKPRPTPTVKQDIKAIKEGIKAGQKVKLSASDRRKIEAGKQAGVRQKDIGTSRGSGNKTRKTRGF